MGILKEAVVMSDNTVSTLSSFLGGCRKRRTRNASSRHISEDNVKDILGAEDRKRLAPMFLWLY